VPTRNLAPHGLELVCPVSVTIPRIHLLSCKLSF
jgi:hypothetical protein